MVEGILAVLSGLLGFLGIALKQSQAPAPRVGEVLPEKSASEQALEQLQAQGKK